MNLIIEFLVIVLTLYALLFFFIPWGTRLVALYGMHGLRDRLYGLASRSPWIRDTLHYRDCEFFLCSSICLLRSKDVNAAIRFAKALKIGNESRIPQHGDWRIRVYRKERESLFKEYPDGFGSLTEMYDIIQNIRPFMVVRSLGGSPPLAIAFGMLILVWVPIHWIRWFGDKLGSGIEQGWILWKGVTVIESGELEQNTVVAGYRLLV